MATESCLSLASSRDRPTSLTVGCRPSRSWSRNPGLIFQKESETFIFAALIQNELFDQEKKSNRGGESEKERL